MKINKKILRPNTEFDSGQVQQYVLPSKDLRITQITTFCPADVGPGAIHLYLIETKDALILLDTGIPTHIVRSTLYTWFDRPVPHEIAALPDHLSEKQLTEGLKIAGYSIEDIDLLILSHGHWDHFLMGRSILNHCRAQVAAHVLETPWVCNPWMSAVFWLTRGKQLKGTGMPALNGSVNFTEKKLEPLFSDYSLTVDLPISQEGDLPADLSIRGIQVKHLPGHTAGSIGLVVGKKGEEQILLCGDAILNPITPIPDDLLAYLRTLEDLKRLEAVRLALPAHGDEIKVLPLRVNFLEKHHYRRLRLTHELCQKERSVWDLATVKGFFDTDVDKGEANFLAASETLVHMEMLRMVDALFRTKVKNGVQYFRATDEPYAAVSARIMSLVQDRKTIPLMRY
ncbi:MAG: MBL fold metallo-hydrolase [Desulfobacterales bacterium]